MRKSFPLPGKVVAVTGASRGIGAATARELAGRGAHVVALGLEPDRLERLIEDLGPGHAWFEADVTDQGAIDSAIRQAVLRFGGIDACVANAGVVNYGTVLTADPDAFHRTIDVNLVGIYRTAAAVMQHLVAAHGHILMVGSVASLVPLPGAAAYAAAKAGADSLAATMRLELARTGVTVGCAYPSWVDTDMVRQAEAALPSFRRLRSQLPWPANKTHSCEACARALVAGIERRVRRIYFPRSVGVIAATRPVITSALADAIALKRAGRTIRELDLDVAALSLVDPTTTDPVEAGLGGPSHA